MRIFFLLFIGLLLTGCASTQGTLKKTSSGKDIHQLIKDKNFQIISEWASPLTANQIPRGLLPVGSGINNISLQSNKNYFILNGEKVNAFLPYYGEQRISKVYNGSGAIKFKSEIKDYKIVYDEEKKLYKIRFRIKDDSELYSIIANLRENLTAVILVNSSHRSSISYTGVVKDIIESK